MSTGTAVPSSWRAARSVLAVRRFRCYWIGQSCSASGSAFAGLALAFAVLARTHSAAALGAVLLASRAPAIVLSLVGGVLGDRCSRRAVMLGADAARALTQAATAALVVWGRDSLWALATLQAASGVGGALFSPAASGLLVELVPKALLRPANSLLQLSRSLASILALGAAGFVVAGAGAGVAFGIDAASYMISTLSLALLGRLARPLPPPAGGLMAQAREGWRAVRERQWLWTYVGHVALLNTLAVCPFFVLGPLVAQRQLGGAAAWAAIAMGYAAGAFGASLVTLRRQPARPMQSAYLASLALAPLLVLLAVSAPLWSLVVAALCAGAQSAAYNVWATATLQACLPASLISRASSVVTVGSLVAVPAGMSLSGLGADTFGTRAVLGSAALTVVVLVLAALTLGGLSNRSEAVAIPGEETHPRVGDQPHSPEGVGPGTAGRRSGSGGQRGGRRQRMILGSRPDGR